MIHTAGLEVRTFGSLSFQFPSSQYIIRQRRASRRLQSAVLHSRVARDRCLYLGSVYSEACGTHVIFSSVDQMAVPSRVRYLIPLLTKEVQYVLTLSTTAFIEWKHFNHMNLICPLSGYLGSRTLSGPSPLRSLFPSRGCCSSRGDETHGSTQRPRIRAYKRHEFPGSPFSSRPQSRSLAFLFLRTRDVP